MAASISPSHGSCGQMMSIRHIAMGISQVSVSSPGQMDAFEQRTSTVVETAALALSDETMQHPMPNLC